MGQATLIAKLAVVAKYLGSLVSVQRPTVRTRSKVQQRVKVPRLCLVSRALDPSNRRVDAVKMIFDCLRDDRIVRRHRFLDEAVPHRKNLALGRGIVEGWTFDTGAASARVEDELEKCF